MTKNCSRQLLPNYTQIYCCCLMFFFLLTKISQLLKETFFFSTTKKENSNNKTNLKNRLEDEVESFSGFFTYNTTNIATDRMMAESETDQQTQQRPTKRKTQRPTGNTVKNILLFFALRMVRPTLLLLLFFMV